MSESLLVWDTWPAGITQASIPANNNARRAEVMTGSVISASTTAQPVSPAERDIYIIPAGATGLQWVTFNEGDVAIYYSATWTAFAPFDGLRKFVEDEGEDWQFIGSGGWAAAGGGGGAVETVAAGHGIDVDATDPQNPIVATDETELDAGLIPFAHSSFSASNVEDAIVEASSGGGGGSVAWGAITGTLSDQTDLDTALSGKQPLDSDLTTIAGLSASNDDFMQRKAGAWAARSILQVAVDLNGDGLTAGSVGARTVPQNSKSAAYTLVAADSGKHIYHPGADTTARIWTIPANASVAYPVGTVLTFVNDTSAGVITIAITSDTLVLAGAGTTGSRTLAANGIATAIKMTSTRWQINGTGLT